MCTNYTASLVASLRYLAMVIATYFIVEVYIARLHYIVATTLTLIRLLLPSLVMRVLLTNSV